MRLIGAGAFLVSSLADATDGGERAIDQADDLTDDDLPGRPGQPITAEFSASAFDQTGLLQQLVMICSRNLTGSFSLSASSVT